MLTCSFKPISPCRVASLGINFTHATNTGAIIMEKKSKFCPKPRTYGIYWGDKLQRTHVTSWSCLLCNLLLPAMNLMLVTLNLTTSPITSFCLNWFWLFWLLLSYRMIMPIQEMLNTMLGGVWPSSAKGTLTGSKFSIQIWFVHISSTLQPLGTK